MKQLVCPLERAIREEDKSQTNGDKTKSLDSLKGGSKDGQSP
jgi:hypothetical protein